MYLLRIAKSSSAKEWAIATSTSMPSESALIIGDVILEEAPLQALFPLLPALTAIVANLMQSM